MRKFAAFAIAGVLTATLTACAAGVEHGELTPAAGQQQVCAQGGFTAASVRLQGPWYTVDVPQVAGGTDAARTEFNTAMRGLAQGWIDRVDGTIVLEPGTGQVTYLGTRVLSGLLVVSVNGGGAHPNNALETHVTNADTGAPITLTDLFTDVQAGLDVLAEQAAIEVPKTRAGDTYSKSGIEAAEFNYRLWLATPGGMEIHFGEIASHAAGDIVITVPWSKLASVLKPGIREVVSS